MSRKMFSGVIPNTETQYVNLYVRSDGVVAGQVAWLDDASDASITLQVSYYSAHNAPSDEDGEAWHWEDDDATIPAPEGSAEGTGTFVATGVYGRARLKITAAADCNIEVIQ